MGNSGGNILSRIFGMLGATLILIVVVIMILLGADNVVDSYVQHSTTSFVDTCRTTGKIDRDAYNQYAKKIHGMGVFEISLQHDQKLAFSDGHNSRIGYYSHNTDQILTYMYESNDGEGADYAMNNGDNLTIKIMRKKQSQALKLLSFLVGGGISNQPSLVVNYSGTVGSNG